MALSLNFDGVKAANCPWCHSDLDFYGKKDTYAPGDQVLRCPVCHAPITVTNKPDETGFISSLFGSNIAIQWEQDTVQVINRVEPKISYDEWAQAHPEAAANMSVPMGQAQTNAPANPLTIFRAMIGADPLTGDKNGNNMDWIFWAMIVGYGVLIPFILVKKNSITVITKK
jgi:hypothetical protein